MNITPRFFLKKPSSTKPTLVCLLFYIKGQRFVWSTGESILPIHWDNSACRPFTDMLNLNQITQKSIPKETLKDLIRLKTRIDLIEGKTLQIIDHLSFQGKTLDFKELKEELSQAFTPGLTPEDPTRLMTLVEFADHFITTSTHKYNTIKGYRTTYNVLKDYQKKKRIKLDFDSIGLDFYNDFVRYCMDHNYTKNTIGGFIKHVKVFMNNAMDRGLTKNNQHLNRHFTTLEEKVDTIYLSIKELQKIEKVNLKGKKSLDPIRDLFLIACYTGLRFGDLMQLRKENISRHGSGHIIKLRTQKTDEMVVIPVHPIILSILKKYGNDLPRPISDQKMNKALKEIAELAKIKDRVRIAKTVGGLNTPKDYFKYELITIHTARRSFATNMYLSDVPAISIMKITGHKSEKAFLKYIRITPEQNAMKLMSHPFFQQNKPTGGKLQ
jgi:integrase